MDPTPGRQHTDQGSLRKQQLLDRAADLFAERGYAATRVIDICDSAGVAKGLFYWYFASKDDLLRQLVDWMRWRLRRAQADAIDTTADPLTQIRQGAEASVRFMAVHASYFTLLDVEYRDAARAAHVREGDRVHMGDTARLVKAAQEAGRIPDTADPHVLALCVNGTVAQFSHFHRAGRLPLDIDELAAFVGSWVERALGGAPASPDASPSP